MGAGVKLVKIELTNLKNIMKLMPLFREQILAVLHGEQEDIYDFDMTDDFDKLVSDKRKERIRKR